MVLPVECQLTLKEVVPLFYLLLCIRGMLEGVCAGGSPHTAAHPPKLGVSADRPLVLPQAIHKCLSIFYHLVRVIKASAGAPVEKEVRGVVVILTLCRSLCQCR